MEQVKKLRIKNDLGLHARAATSIVKLVNQYNSRLFLKKDGHEVDGSNILSILALSCPCGAEVEARVVGEDSEMLMKELSRLFEREFEEHK